MTLSEAWCRTYTRLIPVDEAERRQREIASHVHDAMREGVSASRLSVETAIGAPADLLWSAGIRRRHGLAPLWLMPFLDASIGAIVGGVLILLTLTWSIVGSEAADWPRVTLMYAALLVAGSGHTVALWRRLRR